MSGCLAGKFGTDGGQVMGNDTPADPSGEAKLAVITSASQAKLAFEHADAAFDTGVVAAATSEPGLGFKLTPALCFVAWLGQDDTLDALLGGVGLVGGRIEPAVGTGLVRGTTKQAQMMVNGWLPLGVLRRVAGENGPAGDDPAVDLIQPDLVSKFGLFARFLAANDGGMRLKQADQFLLCWDRLARKHAPHGLVDDLFAVGQYSAQLRQQWRHGGGYLALEVCDDAMCLCDTGFGNVNQTVIGALHTSLGLLAALSCPALNVTRLIACTACVVAKQFGCQPSLSSVIAQAGFDAFQGATDDTHAIGQQFAVAGIADVALDHRAVGAQLAPACDTHLVSQLRQTLIERHERLRLNLVGPAQQRGIIGYVTEVD